MINEHECCRTVELTYLYKKDYFFYNIASHNSIFIYYFPRTILCERITKHSPLLRMWVGKKTLGFMFCVMEREKKSFEWVWIKVN